MSKVESYLQLWHTGAYSHPDLHNGEKPLAPSDVNPGQQFFTTGLHFVNE
ncbi:hypothetical protein L950_0221285 [Sphingobacterium sp. IITKGP-BTPF85]|nr:hypothetical protein L950_0221285 [Sphingobacterium sp. IITKGP-BTPF85]